MNEERFDGRKVAVTGAGGFIGNAICRGLVAEGADVRGLELDPATAERVRAGAPRSTACDVTDRGALEPRLEGADLVVHTAAHVREWGEMEDFVRVNVGGTRNVLDAAERGRRGARSSTSARSSSTATTSPPSRTRTPSTAPTGFPTSTPRARPTRWRGAAARS